jgi:integrase family protein
MKERLMKEIQQRMSNMLNDRQKEQLKVVLSDSLRGYSVSAVLDIGEEETLENNRLLDLFIAAKRVEGCSAKTLHYYKETIRKMFADINLGVRDIFTENLRVYLGKYQEDNNVSRVTIDNVRRILSSFFSWLEDEDYIIKSPVRRIHKVKTAKIIKEAFTDETIEILRDTCNEVRNLAIVELLDSSGMRVGELVKLNRNDINFNERSCIVFGKGSSEREVYFDAKTKIHLWQYLNNRKDEDPALFVSLRDPHERMTISGVELLLRKLGQAAKIENVHPHRFRRTLATRAIDKGMPIEQVQKLLGHVKIDTTMHYALVNQSNVKMSHRRFVA